MIDGLLAFSRITRRELPDTVVDLDCLLDDVLATMRLPAEASLTRQPLPVVRGDAAQLESVLRNLLSNALKFCRNVPEIRVGCLRVDDAWEITVCDNGIGIAPALPRGNLRHLPPTAHLRPIPRLRHRPGQCEEDYRAPRRHGAGAVHPWRRLRVLRASSRNYREYRGKCLTRQ
jgi:hypothetical protein